MTKEKRTTQRVASVAPHGSALHTPASSDFQEPDVSFLDILRRARPAASTSWPSPTTTRWPAIRRMQEEIHQLELLEELGRLKDGGSGAARRVPPAAEAGSGPAGLRVHGHLRLPHPGHLPARPSRSARSSTCCSASTSPPISSTWVVDGGRHQRCADRLPHDRRGRRAGDRRPRQLHQRRGHARLRLRRPDQDRLHPGSQPACAGGDRPGAEGPALDGGFLQRHQARVPAPHALHPGIRFPPPARPTRTTGRTWASATGPRRSCCRRSRSRR